MDSNLHGHECNCSQESDAQRYKRLDEVIESYKNKEGSLIQILHTAQVIFGYIPPALQEYIAENMNIPIAKVHGVVTFYSHFNTEPNGEHVIKVCMGTACFVRGGREILEALSEELHIGVEETTPDGKYTLGITRCIGACGLAPAVTIDATIYQMMDAKKARKILKDKEV